MVAWWCFSNRDLEPEILQACIATIELQAQARLLRAILDAYHARLPEQVKQRILEALEEAEAIQEALTRKADPIIYKMVREERAVDQ